MSIVTVIFAIFRVGAPTHPAATSPLECPSSRFVYSLACYINRMSDNIYIYIQDITWTAETYIAVIPDQCACVCVCKCVFVCVLCLGLPCFHCFRLMSVRSIQLNRIDAVAVSSVLSCPVGIVLYCIA